MSKWTFGFGFIIDFEQLVPEARDMEVIDTAKMAAIIAAADIEALVAASVPPGGIAHDDYARGALVDRWSDTPLDYARDIAPHVSLAVSFTGFHDRYRPLYGAAYYGCEVTVEGSEEFARFLAQNAADEWNDGDMSGYEFRQVGETV